MIVLIRKLLIRHFTAFRDSRFVYFKDGYMAIRILSYKYRYIDIFRMEYTLENAEGQSKTEHRIYAKIATTSQHGTQNLKTNNSTIQKTKKKMSNMIPIKKVVT